MLLCFLQEHKGRAEKGLVSSMAAAERHPTNVQFQGMVDHFAKLLTVIEDMGNWLDGKQRWLPTYLAHLTQMESASCPPQR